MYFLVSQSTCSDPALGSILYIIKNLLGMVQIIAPILLIIMLSIHLTNMVRNPDDKKGLPKIKNAAIAMVVIFLIPTIVNAAMYMLGDNFVVSDCWNNASKGSTTPTYVDPNGGKRQKIGTDPSEYEAGNEKKSGSTSGNVNATGKYYPALKGSGFSISRANKTGGCANDSVYHDLGISEGTKIYAGMDGELQYIQFLCNGVLYSYGNQARLTDPSTGTYILYGHLSKFEGVSTPSAQTCHAVYGKNASCGAGACSSGLQKKVVLKKTVKRGELIGYTGNTGNSEGPHLHVEIHERGNSTCVTDPYAAMGMR